MATTERNQLQTVTSFAASKTVNVYADGDAGNTSLYNTTTDADGEWVYIIPTDLSAVDFYDIVYQEGESDELTVAHQYLGVAKRLVDEVLLKIGGTMSGAIAMGNNKITGLAAGASNGEAVRYDEFSTNNTATGLNTTHRGSSGTDHSNVGLNNTHRTSDGSDHSFIDQDVTSGSSPTFAVTNFTGLAMTLGTGEVYTADANDDIVPNGGTGTLGQSDDGWDALYADTLRFTAGLGNNNIYFGNATSAYFRLYGSGGTEFGYWYFYKAAGSPTDNATFAPGTNMYLRLYSQSPNGGADNGAIRLSMVNTLATAGDKLVVIENPVNTIKAYVDYSGSGLWAGFSSAVRTITSSDSATTADHLIRVDSNGGHVTVTLPAVATTRVGMEIIIKLVDATNTAIVDGNASEEIDGQTSITIVTLYDFIKVKNNGSSWDVVA